MARYYCGMLDGKLTNVIAQDDTGVYETASLDLILKIYSPSKTEIMSQGKAKTINTTDRDFLEFMRVVEHSNYNPDTFTEIKEIEGSAKDVIKQVIAAGGK